MKSITNIFLSMLFLSGCISEIMEEPFIQDADNYEAEEIRTRSSQSMAYYWCHDKKIYLPVDENNHFAIFRESTLETLPMLSSLNAGIEFKDYNFNASSTRGETEEKFFWAKVDSEIAQAYSDEIVYLAPYLVGSSNDLGVTDRFYVKLKSEADYGLLKTFADEHGAKIDEENFMPLWYSLVCTEQASENALTLSNMAYESGKFDKTDVEFLGNLVWDIVDQSYNDPYYTDQWNLNGTYGIDLKGIHSITYGSSAVKVAVIDSGTLIGHPDLPIYMSWDAESQTSPAQLSYIHNTNTIHPHGTQMASIIGSTPNNGIGMAGIAPGVVLYPISIGLYGYESLAVRAIIHAADVGVKVASNSYTFSEQKTTTDEAFNYALSKGCIIVQSSGNANATVTRYPYASIPEIISVGNITSEGMRWIASSSSSAGSTYGQHLDVVAPGTDIMTLKPNGEYEVCTGTSPACPHVAATAALMLSVNNELTPKQVADIIEITARKLPAYNFGINNSRPNGKWHEQVGYGLVNPVEALRLAKGYYSLASFEYSGQSISLTLTANEDIAVIWDWETEDITEIDVTSTTTRTIEHTYTTSGTRRIYIAEKIDFDTDTLSYNSTALVKFDLTTGNYASNFEFMPYNAALEYIRIIGGSNFATQTVSIADLPALKDLYLVRMPNANVTIARCPLLLRFGSSREIWRGPLIDLLFPSPLIQPGSEQPLDPDVVIDGPITQVQWPDIPESCVSYMLLSITDCDNLQKVSLENVNICAFDFSDFPDLEYLYVSSQSHRIVGGGSNFLSPSCNGEFLASTVSTLPQRSTSSKGKILIRGVDSDNQSYTKAWISSQNQSLIEETCSDKNWEVVWDSGITNTGL